MERKPTEIMLFNARERAQPLPVKLTSTDIVTLALESIELVKLIATEERDLAAIRADYELRIKFLRDLHEEVLVFMEQAYKERAQMINVINQNAQLLIIAGEYQAATEIMLRLTAFLSDNSPLRSVTELRRNP